MPIKHSAQRTNKMRGMPSSNIARNVRSEEATDRGRTRCSGGGPGGGNGRSRGGMAAGERTWVVRGAGSLSRHRLQTEYHAQ